jgi:hypothetical protein
MTKAQGGKAMNPSISFAAAITLLVTAGAPSFAGPRDDEKGKTCRMEQQCRWENFKKICTWVKVCR